MRSFTNHSTKFAGIDTPVPVPVDITWFPPGQNVCQFKLTWVGAGRDSALAGHTANGTLPITIRADRMPLVVIDTAGLPVTTGLVKANAGWLTTRAAPAVATLPAPSRLSACRRSIDADATPPAADAREPTREWEPNIFCSPLKPPVADTLPLMADDRYATEQRW
jgi:hypothetical protein